MDREKIKKKVMEYPFLFQSGENLCVDKGNPHKVIFLGLGGSHAYGTNNENSDLDTRGIALRTKEEILLGQDFDQFLDTETDTVIYSFDKMVKLLTECNPNTIEILGLREQDILYKDDFAAKMLLENKKAFLSKKAIGSFGGYANAQLQRLKNKSMRGMPQTEQEEHILKSIEHAMLTIKERYRKEGINLNLYIDKAVNSDMDTEIFMDADIKKYPLRDYRDLWAELNSIIKSYKKFGKRNKNAMSRGKLTKHCMHLVRLYYMVFDILEYGEINTYREKERDFLLKIRDGMFFDGDFPKEELFVYVDKLNRRLEYLKEYTAIPEQPDYKKINEMICAVNEAIVNQKM